jgi:hypothetical protein
VIRVGAVVRKPLAVRPDPGRPEPHALIEPCEPMQLERYEQALADTRANWVRWEP